MVAGPVRSARRSRIRQRGAAGKTGAAGGGGPAARGAGCPCGSFNLYRRAVAAHAAWMRQLPADRTVGNLGPVFRRRMQAMTTELELRNRETVLALYRATGRGDWGK